MFIVAYFLITRALTIESSVQWVALRSSAMNFLEERHLKIALLGLGIW